MIWPNPHANKKMPHQSGGSSWKWKYDTWKVFQNPFPNGFNSAFIKLLPKNCKATVWTINEYSSKPSEKEVHFEFTARIIVPLFSHFLNALRKRKKEQDFSYLYHLHIAVSNLQQTNVHRKRPKYVYVACDCRNKFFLVSRRNWESSVKNNSVWDYFPISILL